jgi:hypothetical protein
LASSKDSQKIAWILGLTSYYHKFVKNYGKIATSLTALLKKNSFTWNPAAAQAFQTLKMAMCTTPVVALLDFTKTFVLECDSSRKGIGTILMQEGRYLAFTNKQLLEKNLGKSIYEKEMLAILHVMELWHHYLLGKCFQIKTNQQRMRPTKEMRQHKWMQKTKNMPQGTMLKK